MAEPPTVDWGTVPHTALRAKCGPFAFYSIAAGYFITSGQQRSRCFALLSARGVHVLDEVCTALAFIGLGDLYRVVSNAKREGFFPGADGTMLPDTAPAEAFVAFMVRQRPMALDGDDSGGGDMASAVREQYDCAIVTADAGKFVDACSHVLDWRRVAGVQVMSRDDAPSLAQAVTAGMSLNLPQDNGEFANKRRTEAFVALEAVPRRAQGDTQQQQAVADVQRARGAQATAGVPSHSRLAAHDPTTGLAYVDVPLEHRHYFPNLSAAAVVWFDDCVAWEPPAHPGRVFGFLTATHLYVMQDRELCTRCVHIADVERVLVPQREQTSLTNADGVNLARFGALVVVAGEHDLFVGFKAENALRKLVRLLAMISSKMGNGSGLNLQFTESLDAHTRRPRPSGFNAVYVDPPPRAITSATDRPVDGSGGGSGTMGQNGLMLMDPIPNDMIEDFPQLLHAAVVWAGRILDITDTAARPLTASSGMGRDGPAAQAAAAQAGANVLKALSRGGDNAVGVITNSHVYVAPARSDQVKRCISLKAIRKILVKAVPPMSRPPTQAESAVKPDLIARGVVVPARTYILLVCREPEYDALLMMRSSDEAKVFMGCIAKALKAWDTNARPMLGTFDDPAEENARLIPPKQYKLSAPRLPKRADAPPHYGRLVRFYDKYMPEKVKEADRVLVAFRGREDELFAKLVKRYGPEPDASVRNMDVVATARPAHDTFDARLTRFFKQYCPDKLHTVDGTVAAYKNDEAALFASLVRQYGPEPRTTASGSDAATISILPPAASPSSAPTTRVMALRVLDANPATRGTKPETVDDDLERNKGAESEYLSELVERYGTPPAFDRASVANTVSAIYAKYAPEKLHNADAMLAKYEGREQYMLEQLEKRYGPAPAAGAASEGRRVLEGKLQAFYRKHDPAKLQNVGAIMAKFDGNEAALWSRLNRKYNTNAGPDGSDPSPQRRASSPSSSMQPRPVHRSRSAADAGGSSFLAEEPAAALPHVGLGQAAGEPLPYAEIPPAQRPMFPSLPQASVYYLNRAAHFDPPQPTVLRYLILSPTHLYVADDEHSVHRCLPLRHIHAVVGTFGRRDRAANVVILLQCQPDEHDLMVAFPNDVQGKRFVWFVLEVIGQFQFGHAVRAATVESFSAAGITPDCTAPPWYVCPVVPLPPRAKVNLPIAAAESGGGQPTAMRHSEIFGSPRTDVRSSKHGTAAIEPVPRFNEYAHDETTIMKLREQEAADNDGFAASRGGPAALTSANRNLYYGNGAASPRPVYPPAPRGPQFEVVDVPRDLNDSFVSAAASPARERTNPLFRPRMDATPRDVIPYTPNDVPASHYAGDGAKGWSRRGEVDARHLPTVPVPGVYDAPGEIDGAGYNPFSPPRGRGGDPWGSPTYGAGVYGSPPPPTHSRSNSPPRGNQSYGRVTAGVPGGKVQQDRSASAPFATVSIGEMSTVDIATALVELGLGEHVQYFSRTDGKLLQLMSLDDIRRRMRGDEEAADILFVWLEDQLRRSRAQPGSSPSPQRPGRRPDTGPRFPTGPLVDPDL